MPQQSSTWVTDSSIVRAEGVHARTHLTQLVNCPCDTRMVRRSLAQETFCLPTGV
jgi:hypothetical protein